MPGGGGDSSPGGGGERKGRSRGGGVGGPPRPRGSERARVDPGGPPGFGFGDDPFQASASQLLTGGAAGTALANAGAGAAVRGGPGAAFETGGGARGMPTHPHPHPDAGSPRGMPPRFGRLHTGISAASEHGAPAAAAVALLGGHVHGLSGLNVVNGFASDGAPRLHRRSFDAAFIQRGRTETERATRANPNGNAAEGREATHAHAPSVNTGGTHPVGDGTGGVPNASQVLGGMSALGIHQSGAAAGAHAGVPGVGVVVGFGGEGHPAALRARRSMDVGAMARANANATNSAANNANVQLYPGGWGMGPAPGVAVADAGMGGGHSLPGFELRGPAEAGHAPLARSESEGLPLPTDAEAARKQAHAPPRNSSFQHLGMIEGVLGDEGGNANNAGRARGGGFLGA